MLYFQNEDGPEVQSIKTEEPTVFEPKTVGLPLWNEDAPEVQSIKIEEPTVFEPPQALPGPSTASLEQKVRLNQDDTAAVGKNRLCTTESRQQV